MENLEFLVFFGGLIIGFRMKEIREKVPSYDYILFIFWIDLDFYANKNGLNLCYQAAEPKPTDL